MRMLVVGMCIAIVAGCAPRAEFGDAVGPAEEAADYPDLVPLAPILAQVDEDIEASEDTDDILQSRADALEARSAGLRGDVLSPQERARFDAGIE